jgi:hypothetical protein
MTAIMPLLREASDAGLSFRFADGEIRLSGKAPPPDLLSRLRAERPAILAHFKRAQARQVREEFTTAVQAFWPGARIVDERIYTARVAAAESEDPT